MRVAAFGRTHWLYDAIEAVSARGHEIVLVGTTAAAPEYQRTEDDFRRLAERLDCPLFVNARLGDPPVRALLASCGADVAISVNWPTLVPASVRTLFPHGVLNGHSGALPRYRGNACPNWAILAGESTVGVTVHQMADELDAGDILVQEHIPVGPDDYIADVYGEIERRFPRMFADAIDGLAAGTLTPQPQSTDPADALRCYPRKPVDGLIDWRDSADAIARRVRASAEPFAGAYSWYEGQRLRIWRARAVSEPCPSLGVPGQVTRIDRVRGVVGVLCGHGELELQQVELANGGRVAPAAIVRSTRDRLGRDVEEELAALRERVAQLEALLTTADRFTTPTR